MQKHLLRLPPRRQRPRSVWVQMGVAALTAAPYSQVGSKRPLHPLKFLQVRSKPAPFSQLPLRGSFKKGLDLLAPQHPSVDLLPELTAQVLPRLKPAQHLLRLLTLHCWKANSIKTAKILAKYQKKNSPIFWWRLCKLIASLDHFCSFIANFIAQTITNINTFYFLQKCWAQSSY